MMQHAIDRSRQTGGAFATSTVVHVAMLLLLAFWVGREAVDRMVGDELTEIAYIEARYGEDVAEKVKIRQQAPPGPAGPGITTDSAVKRPESKPAAPAEPVVAEPTPAPLPAEPQPKLQQKQLPPPARLAPQKLEPQRPALAAAPAVDVAPTAAPRRELAQASQLEAKVAPAPSRRVIDSDKLGDSLAGKLTEADNTSPRPTPAATRKAFEPEAGALRDRGGLAPAAAAPVVAAAPSRRGGAVAEAPASLGGASLSGRQDGGAAYSAPRASLAPAGVASAGMGGGLMDGGAAVAAAPAPRSGRKTILDYGEGGGGGGLVGRRGRIAEAPASRDIVAKVSEPSGPKVQEADAAQALASGVGMTISGEIAGRKILHRVAARYSDAARRQGWEGMVAVHFTVLPDGRVKDNVYFEQTSVHRDLNQAAMAAIRQFRFAPLAADQGAVEQWGVITIVFRLN
jgi:TonB family protein